MENNLKVMSNFINNYNKLKEKYQIRINRYASQISKASAEEKETINEGIRDIKALLANLENEKKIIAGEISDVSIPLNERAQQYWDNATEQEREFIKEELGFETVSDKWELMPFKDRNKFIEDILIPGKLDGILDMFGGSQESVNTKEASLSKQAKDVKNIQLGSCMDEDDHFVQFKFPEGSETWEVINEDEESDMVMIKSLDTGRIMGASKTDMVIRASLKIDAKDVYKYEYTGKDGITSDMTEEDMRSLFEDEMADTDEDISFDYYEGWLTGLVSEGKLVRKASLKKEAMQLQDVYFEEIDGELKEVTLEDLFGQYQAGQEGIKGNEVPEDLEDEGFQDWLKERIDNEVTFERKASIEKKAEEIKMEDLKGGKVKDRPEVAFTPESIAKGIKVELEHTKSKPIAEKIALDHLSESPFYYDKLEILENKSFEELNKMIERKSK